MPKIIIILGSCVGVLLVIFTGFIYFQETHFNSSVMIDNTHVGGLTAEAALKKLEETVSKHVVYLGNKQIYDGIDNKIGFSTHDLTSVKDILKKQRTLLPSFSSNNYTLRPSQFNPIQSQTIKKRVEEKLFLMNKSLKTPKNAKVRLVEGKVIVSKGLDGTQYDIPSLLKEYTNQEYNSEIHLKPLYKQPIKTNSPFIAKEKNQLEDLIQRTVYYKLQNKAYEFKGSEVIQNASVTSDGKYEIDITEINKKLENLNVTQSTLNKNYIFKTSSGSVISIKGKTYGWAISVSAEAKRIVDAFIKGTPSILAYNIYGIGWNVNGVGYHTPANYGIGNSYIELSIEEQRIWVYKNGKLKVTTPVVTGTHQYNEDTPKGVWYIEYKQSPAILKGSEVGNSNYSVKVSYWAPFTKSGDGLHDASWRKDWSKNAYIDHGSGGCVNIPPNIMNTVYANVSQYEPVVIY